MSENQDFTPANYVLGMGRIDGRPCAVGWRRTTSVTRGIPQLGRLDPRGWGTLQLIFAITLGTGLFTAVVAVTLIDVRSEPTLGPANRWDMIEIGPDAPYLPTLANVDLGSGANRLSFTIQDVRGEIRGDLEVRVGIYDIAVDPDAAVAEIGGEPLEDDHFWEKLRDQRLPFFGGAGSNYSLHAVAEVVRRDGMRRQVQILMEAEMACGLGICSGCAVFTRKGVRLCCKDGPRFELLDVF